MKQEMTGARAPEFCLPNQEGRNACLGDYRGKWAVLYFYPKDHTPGCTIEAKGFSKAIGEFRGMDAEVIGISPDTVESHRKFSQKHMLNITLLSDTERQVIREYGAEKQKKLFGKQYTGVERSTFIISPEQRIAFEWRGVRPEGHAKKVGEKLAWLRDKK